jgi:hypothetical protein
MKASDIRWFELSIGDAMTARSFDTIDVDSPASTIRELSFTRYLSEGIGLSDSPRVRLVKDRERSLDIHAEERYALDRIAITDVLDQLSPFDRDLICLSVAYSAPVQYDGYWPPGPEDIVRYLEVVYYRRPILKRTMYVRLERAYQRARGLAASRWRRG